MKPLPAEAAAERAEKLIAKFEEDHIAFSDMPDPSEVIFTVAEKEREYTAAYRKARGKYLAARLALVRAISG